MELKFMGKIVANMAHEVTNILAAVGENAALIQDVLTYSREAASPLPERIFAAFQTIERQISRGVELASQLNRFAHDTDETMTKVDLNTMLSQVGAFGSRLARLKGVDIRVAPSEESLGLVGNPIRIQMALFDCLDYLLDHLKTRTVVMRSGRTEDGTLEVTYTPEVPGESGKSDVGEPFSTPQWTGLVRSVEGSGGKLVSDGAVGGLSVVFHPTETQCDLKKGGCKAV
ncbi:MAG: hypothetical protein V1792_07110 [Pseudomonadota bacterium]